MDSYLKRPLCNFNRRFYRGDAQVVVEGFFKDIAFLFETQKYVLFPQNNGLIWRGSDTMGVTGSTLNLTMCTRILKLHDFQIAYSKNYQIC